MTTSNQSDAESGNTSTTATTTTAAADAATGEEAPALSPAEAMSQAADYEGDPLECPCIASMKAGTCGPEFITAYKCFLDSKEEEKGSDCYTLFKAMQDCMQKNAEEYSEFMSSKDDEDEDDGPKTKFASGDGGDESLLGSS